MRGDTVIRREGGRGRGLVDWSPDGRGAGRIMWGGGVQIKELLVAQGYSLRRGVFWWDLVQGRAVGW